MPHLIENLKDYEFLEKEDPELWRYCYPKIYDYSNNKYYSPKSLSHMELASFYKTKLGYWGDSEKVEFTYALKSLSYKNPLYWVSETIYESLSKTKLPPIIKWKDLKYPVRSMTFMLPKNSLVHERDGNIVFIGFARVDSDEILKTKFVNHSLTVAGDMFILITRLENGSTLHYTLNDTVLDIQTSDLNALVVDESHVTHKSDWNNIQMDQVDNNIVARSFHLLFGLLLLLANRPSICKSGTLQKKINYKEGIKEFWTPNIIGKDYKIKYVNEKNVVSEMPVGRRLHLVTGHWHTYKIGVKRQESVVHWVEPYWRGHNWE